MAIVVRIPTPLRAMTKGAAEVHAEASTIGDVITDPERQFPGLRDRIVEESGEIRRFVNIYVNQEDIRFLEGDKTALKPGDEVSSGARHCGRRVSFRRSQRSPREAPGRRAGDLRLSARRRRGSSARVRRPRRRDPAGGSRRGRRRGQGLRRMASAVEEALGDRVAGGLVVVKDGHLAETRRVKLVEAGHPVPDERGAAAARDLLALARGAGAEDLVLALISGALPR